MALILDTIKPEIEAADSRFFIDIQSLDVLRSSIVERAASIVGGHRVISREVVEIVSPILEFDVEALHSEIEDLQAAIDARTAKDIFRVIFPSVLSMRNKAYDGLIDDYSVDTQIPDLHIVEFPAESLDVAKVLPFSHSGSHNYQPVVDMRIQTSRDPRAKIMGENGIEELPGSGSWHRFPLKDVEIHLLRVLDQTPDTSTVSTIYT